MKAILIILLFVCLTIAVFAYFKKFFKAFSLSERSGSCLLAGQLKRGMSSAQLPNPLGRHIYTIRTNGGALRMNHHALNPDGFTWSLPPGHGEQEYFNIFGDTINTFAITIGESFGRPDKVEIVNPNYRGDVEFSYKVD